MREFGYRIKSYVCVCVWGGGGMGVKSCVCGYGGQELGCVWV